MRIEDGSASREVPTEHLLEATCFLRERGVQPPIHIDETVLSTGELIERIYQLLGQTPPSWHIPLSVATPIANVSDVTAAITGIDFSITAARISDIQPLERSFTRLRTSFDASKIHEADFEQPVSNEEALRRTVEWHLRAAYGEALPEAVA